jgi:hypothetical protein
VQVDSILDGNGNRPVKGGIFRIGRRHHGQAEYQTPR